MPYAPGVVDNSGMIRAQGILGAAQSYGNGMQAISQGLQAKHLKDEQDQALLAKASSTEKFIKAHADIFGGDEVVKDMLATNPQESPLARYNRTATIMADRVTGMKMESEQQQIQQSKQQQAAQAFVMQQQQLKAQQDAAQRARFEQMMGGVSPGAGGGGQRWPGSGTGPWAGMPAGGAPAPAGAPAGVAPTPDPLTAQSLAYYKATGRVPDSAGVDAIMNDMSRQQVAKIAADERAVAAKERTDARTASPVLTAIPGSDQYISTLNGQQMVVNKPVKSTTVEDKIALAKQIQAAAKSGDYETAAALGMALGHADPITGAPLGPTAYTAFGGPGVPASATMPNAAPAQASAMAKIRTPSGSIMMIPRSNLAAAIAKGASEITGP